MCFHVLRSWLGNPFRVFICVYRAIFCGTVSMSLTGLGWAQFCPSYLVSYSGFFPYYLWPNQCKQEYMQGFIVILRGMSNFSQVPIQCSAVQLLSSHASFWSVGGSGGHSNFLSIIFKPRKFSSDSTTKKYLIGTVWFLNTSS